MVNDKTLMPVECVVEGVSKKQPWTLNLRIVRGNVDSGAELRCVENGKRYRVRGVGLGGWSSHAGGHRIVHLECLDGTIQENPLKEGARLVAEGVRSEGE